MTNTIPTDLTRWNDDARFPTIGPTGTDYTSIDYSSQDLTGTIPTQVRDRGGESVA